MTPVTCSLAPKFPPASPQRPVKQASGRGGPDPDGNYLFRILKIQKGSGTVQQYEH